MRPAHVHSAGIHAHVQAPACYRAADRAGISIVQDFPLQWAYASGTSEDPSFVPRATAMAAEMACLLWNHPSVVAYTAHNEPVHALRSLVGNMIAAKALGRAAAVRLGLAPRTQGRRACAAPDEGPRRRGDRQRQPVPRPPPGRDARNGRPDQVRARGLRRGTRRARVRRHDRGRNRVRRRHGSRAVRLRVRLVPRSRAARTAATTGGRRRGHPGGRRCGTSAVRGSSPPRRSARRATSRATRTCRRSPRSSSARLRSSRSTRPSSSASTAAIPTPAAAGTSSSTTGATSAAACSTWIARPRWPITRSPRRCARGSPPCSWIARCSTRGASTCRCS